MISISKAKPEEVLEIKKLLKETWMSTYAHIFSPESIELVTSEWHSPELLVQQINNPDNFFAVAKDENIIVGMCNASLLQEGKTVNVQRLHISPSYQRQGIGSKLMNEIVKAFPKASMVELEVEKQNYKAQAFYKKLGFKESGEKVFEVNGIKLPCLVMEKSL